MITKNTVLVLGAGASVPYGYPAGLGLWQEITEWTGGAGQSISRALRDANDGDEEISRFHDALFQSGDMSVDAFLGTRTAFEKIGKRAIAAALLGHESVGTLFSESPPNQGRWYKHLYREMVGPALGDFGKNKIAFITFNYDRSLEQFLYVSLKNKYGGDQEKCREALEGIRIVHVHGRLALLPWESKEGFEYDGTVTPDKIRQSADSIKIIPEVADDAESFSDAHDLLKTAERVYFIGFGYEEANIRRLGLGHLPREGVRALAGTSHGLTEKERENALRRLRAAAGPSVPVEFASDEFFGFGEYDALNDRARKRATVTH